MTSVLRERPMVALGVLIVLYIAVTLTLSWVRSLELQTTTWDAGIYQQALWSAAHGPPFYEAPDLETGGFGSFLQVHTAFVLVLLVPLYAALPSPAVLFAAQSFVVGLAALPLAKFGSAVTGSPKLGLVAGIGYLAWAPILTANLYDFHAEAFLPVEFFAFLFLWQTGRYRLGLAVVGLAFATFEIAPVLVFAAAVYFLIPDGARLRSFFASLSTPGSWRALVRQWAGHVFASLRVPRVRITLLLLPLCALTYEVLVLARIYLLAPLLGVGAYPPGANASGYVVGSTPTELGLALDNLSFGLSTKLLGWLIALALLGFVPLLAPRAWVLSLPWFAFSLLSLNLNYVLVGFQYGFILACGLLPAFALGLPRLLRWTEEAGRGILRLLRRPISTGPPTGVDARRTVAWKRSVGPAVLVVFVAVNLLASPLDPALQNNGLGAAYRISYTVAPGFPEVSRLAGLVPAGAPVLATDDLFPLVANDVNAYSLSWTQDPSLLLPFGPSSLPPFVLLSEDRLNAVPPWLENALYDRSEYGLRAAVGVSNAGVDMLFEAGYSGTTEMLSPIARPPVSYAGTELGAGPFGGIVVTPGSRFPTVIASRPGELGNIWNGPGVAAPSGSYDIILWLRAIPSGVAPAPSTPAVFVDGNAFGLGQWFERNLTYGELAGPTWIPITFAVNLSEPVWWIYLRGYSLAPTVVVSLEYLEIRGL